MPQTGDRGSGCPFELHGRQDGGAGTEVIRIQGYGNYTDEHSIIPDRIEAGTYMIAVAAAGGEWFWRTLWLNISGRL